MASLTGMEAELSPLMRLAPEGSMTRSAPMPLVRWRLSLTMPMKMATMDRIMMTSMATASTLMMERRGRCSRLAKMSLFIEDSFFQPTSRLQFQPTSAVPGTESLLLRAASQVRQPYQLADRQKPDITTRTAKISLTGSSSGFIVKVEFPSLGICPCLADGYFWRRPAH